MDFIKKIREEYLQLSAWEMAKKMELMPVQRYITFEKSTKVLTVKSMIKLWEISGLSAEEFLKMISDEVEDNQNT